jgi:hypothetical protein
MVVPIGSDSLALSGLHILCPRPRLEAVRIVDMRSSNLWAELSARYLGMRAAHQNHEFAKAELKKLVPDDAKEAIGRHTGQAIEIGGQSASIFWTRRAPMHRSSERIGAIAAALAKAQSEPAAPPRLVSIAAGGLADGATSGSFLWPQTEIAKAWLAQSETSEPGARDQAEQALVRLYRYYLRHPVPGSWFDQFDANGVSLVDSIPASSLNHVLCAISEGAAVLE